MEKELKFIVPDREACGRLKALLGVPREELTQTNLYYDTPDRRVAQAFSMLRIRRSEKGTRLTFKQGRRQHNGYFEAEEIECRLEDEVDPNQLAHTEPMQRFGQQFQTTEVELLGEVVNRRLVYKLECGEVLELDQTDFPGQTDYEIEVETERPEQVTRELARLVEQAGFRLVAQTETKFSRFLKALSQRR